MINSIFCRKKWGRTSEVTKKLEQQKEMKTNVQSSVEGSRRVFELGCKKKIDDKSIENNFEFKETTTTLTTTTTTTTT